jgi:hypothetical protein
MVLLISRVHYGLPEHCFAHRDLLPPLACLTERSDPCVGGAAFVRTRPFTWATTDRFGGTGRDRGLGLDRRVSGHTPLRFFGF